MKKLLGLLLVLLCTTSVAQSNYIPERAFTYKSTIKLELDTYFSDIPDYNYIPSLIEHESCISLKNSKCWSATSQLKTSREEGAGFLQVTRAYNTDGSVRFDSLKNMRDAYKNELREASWSTIYQKPDVQIRMGVLMVRDDFKKLYNVPSVEERLKMTDASYNGGIGGLLKERRACGMATNCDPNIWFKNVELHCLKSKKVLYGTRSACDINRHHVEDVFNNKLPKYRARYFTKER